MDLVGLGDPSMDDAFYRAAPNLKLVQLLSAGYDRCDIEAVRRVWGRNRWHPAEVLDVDVRVAWPESPAAAAAARSPTSTTPIMPIIAAAAASAGC